MSSCLDKRAQRERRERWGTSRCPFSRNCSSCGMNWLPLLDTEVKLKLVGSVTLCNRYRTRDTNVYKCKVCHHGWSSELESLHMLSIPCENIALEGGGAKTEVCALQAINFFPSFEYWRNSDQFYNSCLSLSGTKLVSTTMIAETSH